MSKSRRTVERYYAVRIGKPGRHFPYFMIDAEGVPRLFVSREKAEEDCPKDATWARVVRVNLST